MVSFLRRLISSCFHGGDRYQAWAVTWGDCLADMSLHESKDEAEDVAAAIAAIDVGIREVRDGGEKCHCVRRAVITFVE